MDIEEIKKLISLMDEKALTELEIEDSERRIRLRKEALPPVEVKRSPSPTSEKEKPHSTEEGTEREEESKNHPIISPIVGTFYKAPSPDANPYISLGDRVKKGQILCVIEAMKLMNEIESDFDGTVVKVCVNDGDAVEYGEALFLIEPA